MAFIKKSNQPPLSLVTFKIAKFTAKNTLEKPYITNRSESFFAGILIKSKTLAAARKTQAKSKQAIQYFIAKTLAF